MHNSLFSVCVIHNYKNNVIGCGRLVGDGGIYFYIQDVIVLPEFQGKGIGKHIMASIMDYLKACAPPNAFVGLMAAKGVSKFYERYDFMERPADAPGMFKIWKKQERVRRCLTERIWLRAFGTSPKSSKAGLQIRSVRCTKERAKIRRNQYETMV